MFQSSEEEKEERGFGDSYFDEKKENKDKGETAYGADEEMLVVTCVTDRRLGIILFH